jgi:Uma2 family endonuclease
MGMPLASHRWTPSQVLALPADGNRYECIDGELLVTPSPRLLHQRALRALYDALGDYVRREALGELLWSPADIEIEPDTLVQPDLFVAGALPGAGRVREWSEITHLRLAIEVLSPGTARYDRGLKRRFYQRAGVDEYWIVDLDARLVERWRPADDRPEICTDALDWSPERTIQPLRVDLGVVFAELD